MIPVLDRWLALADRLSTLAVRSAGAMMLAAAFLVGLDVLLRKTVLITLGGADELSGYAFAVGTTWALAFTLLRRANVRVDALYGQLPTRITSCLDLLALLSLLVFVGYLTWRAVLVLQDSLLFETRATTPLGTPQWIPQSLWILGLLLFLFTIVPLILRATIALVTGDLPKVRHLAGAMTLEESAAEEASHTAELQAPNSRPDR
jgi:TRAP-type mannitol/chloroaromatic compound transport system permease small subunit